MSTNAKNSFYRSPLCEETGALTCLPLCASGDAETEPYVDSGTEFSW